MSQGDDKAAPQNKMDFCIDVFRPHPCFLNKALLITRTKVAK